MTDDNTGKPDLSDRDKALLTWCLAEAYGMTRMTCFRDPLRTQTAELGTEKPTPWHLFAAKADWAAATYEDDEANRRLFVATLPNYVSQTNSLLNQAACLLLAGYVGSRKEAQVYAGAVRRLSPAKWRNADQPLLAALTLTHAHFLYGGNDWRAWTRMFYPDVVGSQLVHGNVGWWTARTLGVADTPEISDMSKHDADIHATCIIALTCSMPRRVLPTYQPFCEAEANGTNDEGDLKVDFGGTW